MSDKKVIVRNSIYNIVGSISPMLVTLVTVPIYIGQIGDSRYGILALVWLMLGYFGLFDLGLGKAVANQIASAKRRRKDQLLEESRIFWTALQFNLVIGIIGGVILYLVGPWIMGQIVSIENQHYGEVIKSLPILSMSIPILTITSIATGYFEGKEEFRDLNVLQVIRDVLFQVIPLVTAFIIGSNVIYLVIAAVVARLIATALLFCTIGIRYSLRKPTFNKKKVRELLAYGGSVTITNIIGPILSSIDRFLIGAMIGTRAVTYYTIPYSISTKVKLITSGLSKALFPKLSFYNTEKAQVLSKKAIYLLITFITPVIILGFMLMGPFLSIWIGEGLAIKSTPVGQIILMGVWINNLAFIPISYLYGQGRPGIVASIHSAELLPYLILLWLLVSNWGVEGAALAWTIRVAVDAFLMFIFADLLDNICYYLSFSSLVIVASFLLTFNDIWYSNFVLGIIATGYLGWGFCNYKMEIYNFIQPIKASFKL